MKKGTVVKVTMNRGPERTGKYVSSDTTGSRGEWWIIKPLEKGAAEFRVRPSCVTAA